LDLKFSMTSHPIPLAIEFIAPGQPLINPREPAATV
jgi:hypothetical protein